MLRLKQFHRSVRTSWCPLLKGPLLFARQHALQMSCKQVDLSSESVITCHDGAPAIVNRLPPHTETVDRI